MDVAVVIRLRHHLLARTQLVRFRERPYMKILIRSLFLAFILTFLMSSSAQIVYAAPAKKTVLVLFPYQIDLPYSVLAMQAIKDEFASARDITIDMYY